MGKKSISILLIAISVLSLAISFTAISNLDKTQKESVKAEQLKDKTEGTLKQVQAKPIDETPKMDKQRAILQHFVQAVANDVKTNSGSDQDGSTYKSYGNEASFEALKGVLAGEGTNNARVMAVNILTSNNPENNQLSNCLGELIVTEDGRNEMKYNILVGITGNKVTSLELFTNQGVKNEKTN